MEYIISDIHGEYNLFIKLLNKIKFSNNDRMIICGDIFDKGNQGIELLKYIRKQSNIIFIIGNHEYEFLKYYNNLMQSLDDNFDTNIVLEKINNYFKHETMKLDWEDLYWLEECPYYYETEKYICVHAGVKLDKDKQVEKLCDTDISYLVYDRKLKEKTCVIHNSKCVFFGHTPTSYLCNDYKIIGYKKHSLNGKINNELTINDFYKIHLDCGVYLGGVLGCFCVDNCKCVYVRK